MTNKTDGKVVEEEKVDSTKIADLKRKLAASKSWVTRTCKTLDILLGDEEVDVVAIEEKLKDVQEKLASFEAIQSQLELEVAESEMEECIEAAAEYRDTKSKTVMRARELCLRV